MEAGRFDVDRPGGKMVATQGDAFLRLDRARAARAYEISALLADCCAATSHGDRAAIVERIHKVEHEADRVIAEVYEVLNRTFVTPLDRSDIYSLAVSLEEVADAVFATALQFVVHAVEDLPEGSRELAALVLQSCEVIQAAVTDLRDMKNLTRSESGASGSTVWRATVTRSTARSSPRCFGQRPTPSG